VQRTRALPFSHLVLNGQKRKNSLYPSELKTLRGSDKSETDRFKVSQKHVATAVGLHEMTINNWETNRTLRAVRLVPRIIEFLDYSTGGQLAFLAATFDDLKGETGIGAHDFRILNNMSTSINIRTSAGGVEHFYLRTSQLETIKTFQKI